jgi:hypothetical protein
MSSTAKDPPWSWTRSQHINTMHPKMTLVLGFTFDCLVLGIANLKTTIWNIVCTTLYYLKCLAWNAADLEYYGQNCWKLSLDIGYCQTWIWVWFGMEKFAQWYCLFICDRHLKLLIPSCVLFFLATGVGLTAVNRVQLLSNRIAPCVGVCFSYKNIGPISTTLVYFPP